MLIRKLNGAGAFVGSALLLAAVVAALPPDAAAKRPGAAGARQARASQGQDGRSTYAAVCMSCHQVDGSGVMGVNPPLIKTTFVLGGEAKLAQIVLNGMSGTVQVDGYSYSRSMPSYSYLSDQQIADVLNYVRSNFGNRASAVTPAQVEAARRKTK